jgi:hypothetical protein
MPGGAAWASELSGELAVVEMKPSRVIQVLGCMAREIGGVTECMKCLCLLEVQSSFLYTLYKFWILLPLVREELGIAYFKPDVFTAPLKLNC